MKTTMLTVCAAASLLTGGAALLYALWLRKREDLPQRVLTPLHICTIGIFFSVLLLFIPVYYTSYSLGDRYGFLRPLLLAVHNTLRVFILDGDYAIIRTTLVGQTMRMRVYYGLYVLVLYVVAPVLTFTNLLSLFKDLKGELRYHWHRFRRHFILSELNAKSVALAKSIRKQFPKSVIVFTDVFTQNAEKDYELLAEANRLNGICLKRDIANLNIYRKKGDVEIFLIGSDESENVSQAAKITAELNRRRKKKNVKIFVFSRKDSSAYILDSVRYDELLASGTEDDEREESFQLRRINEVQRLAWNTVPGMDVFGIARSNGGKIPVLLVGMGSYGMEFFKTLVWFCQFEGFRLQLTVVDKATDGEDGEKSVKSRIERQCPELLRLRPGETEGEPGYDIEIIQGIDMTTSDFSKLLDDKDPHPLSQRIKETRLAIVAMGDDDLNIETAVYLRSLFDRVGSVCANKDRTLSEERIQIYSVVYDDQKSAVCSGGDRSTGEGESLINYKNIPYNIRFIGSMSSQFSYGNIYDAQQEKNAYIYHIGWVAVEAKIHEEWKKAGKEVPDAVWSYIGQDTPKAKALAKTRYERFEYYRASSIAKSMYMQALQGKVGEEKILTDMSDLTVCTGNEKLQTCQCANCLRRKRSEHMRWNAYMRVNGYSYQAGMRADRAKLHDNLTGWDSLSVQDREKD